MSAFALQLRNGLIPAVRDPISNLEAVSFTKCVGVFLSGLADREAERTGIAQYHFVFLSWDCVVLGIFVGVGVPCPAQSTMKR